MILDHVGIVVKSLKEGIDHWIKVFGYRQMTEVVLNTRQKVKVVFMEKENSLPVKLLEPADETSPVQDFATRGGGLHHLCFKCDDLNGQIEALKEHKKEIRIMVKPQPGEAFDNENIAFALTRQNTNIELIDTDKRAKRR